MGKRRTFLGWALRYTIENIYKNYASSIHHIVLPVSQEQSMW
jgi:hypothetical protein